MDQTSIAIPQELFAIAGSSSFAGSYLPEALQAGPDAYRFAAPLAWKVTVTNTGGALLVAGTVSGVGETECARCLEDVRVPIEGEIEAYFLIESEGEVLDEEAAEDGEFETLGPDHTIDLVPLIEAAVLMDVPLQPLCKPDCAGICPDCGVNLNLEHCDCARKRAQEDAEFEALKNPFAKLRELDLGQLAGEGGSASGQARAGEAGGQADAESGSGDSGRRSFA